MTLIRSHDALFRFVFGDPDAAADLFRATMPATAASGIVWSSLQRVDGTFVDDGLAGRQADLVFVARAGRGRVLLYLLLEHKAASDRFTALQLTRYVVRLLDDWRARHPRARTLPAVLPFVLHHGARPWRAPCDVAELVDGHGMSAGVRHWHAPHQLRLRFHLLDLAAFDEARLDGLRLSAVAALTVRFLQLLRERTIARAAEDIARWQQLIVEVLDHTRGRDVLRALFSWLLAGAADRRASLRVLMTKIHERNPPVRSLLDLVLEEGEKRGVERGMQQGMQQGMEQGELAGLRLLLGDQLRARFGELPGSVAARIAAAGRVELTRWGRTVLSAATLDDVFAPRA